MDNVPSDDADLSHTVFVTTVWTQTVSEGLTLDDGCIDLTADISSVEGVVMEESVSVNCKVLEEGLPLVAGGHVSLPTPV